MIVPIALLLSALLIVTFGFGWNLAVRKHRASRRKLTVAIGNLEQQVQTVNEALDTDPQRAGIDMGKRYATNQMQHTIDQLREELP